MAKIPGYKKRVTPGAAPREQVAGIDPAKVQEPFKVIRSDLDATKKTLQKMWHAEQESADKAAAQREFLAYQRKAITLNKVELTKKKWDANGIWGNAGKNYREYADEGVTSLANERQVGMFRGMVQKKNLFYQDRLQGHEFTQVKTAQVEDSRAQADIASEEAVGEFNNPNRMAISGREAFLAAVASQKEQGHFRRARTKDGKMISVLTDSGKKNVRDSMAKIHVGRIDAMLDASQIDTAREYLKQPVVLAGEYGLEKDEIAELKRKIDEASSLEVAQNAADIIAHSGEPMSEWLNNIERLRSNLGLKNPATYELARKMIKERMASEDDARRRILDGHFQAGSKIVDDAIRNGSSKGKILAEILPKTLYDKLDHDSRRNLNILLRENREKEREPTPAEIHTYMTFVQNWSQRTGNIADMTPKEFISKIRNKVAPRHRTMVEQMYKTAADRDSELARRLKLQLPEGTGLLNKFKGAGIISKKATWGNLGGPGQAKKIMELTDEVQNEIIRQKAESPGDRNKIENEIIAAAIVKDPGLFRWRTIVPIISGEETITEIDITVDDRPVSVEDKLDMVRLIRSRGGVASVDKLKTIFQILGRQKRGTATAEDMRKLEALLSSKET